MKKENYNIEKVLDDKTNTVKVVETYDINRYEPQIIGGCECECECVVESIKECCQIYIPKGEYKCLSTFEMNYDSFKLCIRIILCSVVCLTKFPRYLGNT